MTFNRIHLPQKSNFQNEIQQFFDKFLNNDENDQSSVVTAHWAPRVDISEEQHLDLEREAAAAFARD